MKGLFLHFHYVTFNKASATQTKQVPGKEKNRGKPHMKRSWDHFSMTEKSQLLHIFVVKYIMV